MQKSKQFKLNVGSIILNIIAIAMLCTPMYCVSVNGLGYSENIWIGMFNLSGGNVISLIKKSPEIVDGTLWGTFYGISSLLALMVAISLIYLIHHVLNYTFIHKRTEENFFVTDHMYINIDEFYYEYSVFPLLTSVVFSWVVLLVYSNEISMIYTSMTVSPVPTLIIATVLLFIQIVVNLTYKRK